MDNELLVHIKRQAPILDVHKKFMFFSNYKVGLGSILRGCIEDRSIIPIATLHRLRRRKNYNTFINSWSQEEMKNAFKFTIVRNPWDRAVSAFFFLKNLENRVHIDKDESFQYFVKNKLAKVKNPVEIDWHFHRQFTNVFFGESIFVDYIGRFETLWADWGHIASIIECSNELPHFNVGKHEHYSRYYDKETKDIIARIYRKDIERFGYKFES